MSEEETSSSSADEQMKSALSPTPPKSVEKNESGDAKRNASDKNDRKGNSNNYTGKKKRKRRQRSKSEDERELIELQKERYDRLIYTARKQLHKTAKQIKTFLLQKEIRKKGSTGVDAKKALDLDVVTSQAIRQLGLYHCDPRFKIAIEDATLEDDPTETDESKPQESLPAKEESGSKRKYRSKNDNKKDDNTPPEIPLPLASDDPRKPLIDAVLAHKRFSKSLEEWNEKVTEYRRWCMKLEQRNNPNPFGMDDDFVPSKRSKKNKNKQKAKSIADAGLQATVENESSLFCTLGGGVPDVGIEKEEFNKYSQYGPGADMSEAPKRKNRKGQRQRRAKALAIEAKKWGRSHEYYQSANWREPKAKRENEDDQGRHKSRGRGREPNRNQQPMQHPRETQDYDYSSSNQPKQQQQQQHNSSNQDADEKQHPSWAAKQAQSTGIVAFKGTKITF
uniref:Bud22 domain-containing protein n=1 Tax=Pseudo-nitzschia delicatissima TaxID=44447 RepID=A0A7S0T8T7_9STRA|mmetsp:Transcript_1634/g.3812  ORF Transcript_1634/g.3812 Transcript_1634/m.3812 type:complete len:450 (+) Transcript_1634:102-1451(+)